ncbi:hypothetical protein BM536_029435 [Streptomyces phaeoluteigriseus]|uniref:Lipoprotein n=1 Tax=Streptomyces phaeoluteigriseus TaxID=114686 RepID=A0A1V6ML96_9ACTN|nr:hypothetical protein [Streptomyces phaeoluteigriseus]OQD53234.1 hypothetical protein BM536_029435 [Streptomyces phaeoluteigriseus]
MRRGFVAVTVLTAVVAGGCGAEGRDVVVEGTPPATPYSGPLDIPVEDVDESTRGALLATTGAAGRALECDGEIFGGNGPDGWGSGDGGDTPEDGLRLYFDLFTPEVPRSGYRVERRGTDRVLYSFDVGGRTKVAVVVAHDQQDRPGWGPETDASCDPAELPAEFTGSGRYEFWTDAQGERQPVARIHSSVGPEHCDWQTVRFLTLGRGERATTYVRDPDGALGTAVQTAPYDPDVPLPADARDTGYRHGEWRLWLTDDRRTAYVRTPDGVEAWPSVTDGVACM